MLEVVQIALSETSLIYLDIRDNNENAISKVLQLFSHAKPPCRRLAYVPTKSIRSRLRFHFDPVTKPPALHTPALQNGFYYRYPFPSLSKLYIKNHHVMTAIP